ncbi:MAG: MFS transporter [Alphaproteobacteria bacterium]|nr:MFS transporter [Alphaproteobacteria bacterium]
MSILTERPDGASPPAIPESPYAWFRLAASVLISTLGGVGMWAIVVVLPSIQADFGVSRADVSLAYTLNMIGFGAGSILGGRLSDQRGIAFTAALGSGLLGLGFIAVSLAPWLWLFAILQGVAIGMGSATTFGPIMADVSHWFDKRRGLAVALSASGNYFAGAIWPPILQHFTQEAGWRATHMGIGVFLLLVMLPLTLALRRASPQLHAAPGTVATGALGPESLGLTSRQLQVILACAGIACCIAMSMPQVHIVAYCGDLGYGVARGAEMLSLMLAFGVISRIASGWIADRIGGIRTLMLGSVLQGTALVFYLLFDGLTSLYVVSALFGLFQGGIVPSYAIIVREYFPAKEAGARVGIVLTATISGMALGGWLSGVVFDLTGSYRAAFANGIAWNLVNGAIAYWLIRRGGVRPALA